MSDYVYRLARDYVAAGISVFPLLLDGSKSPASASLPLVCSLKTKKQSGTWNYFRHQFATDGQLRDWFSGERHAVGMVCGIISGGLEVLDFDDGELFDPWYRKVSAIVDRLPVVETPSSGWHVLYRCREIGGNIKIAKDPSREKQTLIETRGEGGYIVAEGSPVEVHKAGLPYAQYSGPALPEIPNITPEERTELWKAARSFDRSGAREKLLRKFTRPISTGNGNDPLVNWFNANHTWPQILEPHGWTTFNGSTWTRPGKKPGEKSAHIGIANDGEELLLVWSGNAGALAPATGELAKLNKFEAWKRLNFSGDGRAAKAAIKEGRS